MRTAFRSVATVNRQAMTGTAIIVALSAALLTAAGAWLQAGIFNPELFQLTAIAASFAGTVLMLTIFIVASTMGSAIHARRAEFALLRAIGSTNSQIRRSISNEALVITGLMGPIGILLGFILAPLVSPLMKAAGVLPATFDLGWSPLVALGTLAFLTPTALVAGRLSARGVLAVSPTAALRDSTYELAGPLSRGRKIAAVIVAAAGLSGAVAPLFLPGTAGAATGAVSTILFVFAAGLIGPLLVRAAADRAAHLIGAGSGAGRVLAVTNARGFASRLSASIIPLALLFALGSVQTGLNATMIEAARGQLGAGVVADLVATSSGTTPLTAEDVATLSTIPGVESATPIGHSTASIRTEEPDEDMSILSNTEWEPVSVLTIPARATSIDPGIITGSLADLRDADSIAVSTDALAFTGKTVGDTIDMRLPGADARQATIVAVYNRGLGFGDYITVAPTGPEATLDTIYINTASMPSTTVMNAIQNLGFTATTTGAYAEQTAHGAGAPQQLSTVLLLVLLGFLAAAAANTLVMITSGRGEEFLLLRRLGATRAQLMRMVAIETLFIIAAALGLGVLAVLPALAGIGQVLVGVPIPTLDWPITGGLALAVVLLAAITVPLVAASVLPKKSLASTAR